MLEKWQVKAGGRGNKNKQYASADSKHHSERRAAVCGRHLKPCRTLSISEKSDRPQRGFAD